MLSLLHEALRWWALRTAVLHPLMLNEVGWTADGFHVDDPHVVTPAAPQMAVDAILQLTAQGRAVGALLYEVQLSRNPAKPFTWVAYIGGAIGTTARPALLCVITIDAKVSSWARNTLNDSPALPYRFVVAGPDEWHRWATASDVHDPTLDLLAWLSGRCLDRLPAELSSHLERCDRLDLEERHRYNWLLLHAIDRLPQPLAEVLMSQMNQSPRFFPFHPKEVAAFKEGREEGRKEGRDEARKEQTSELRDQVLADLEEVRPDLAAALRDEADVQVILKALVRAAAH